MDLLTVFIIIGLAILLLVGILWLLSALMSSRQEKDEMAEMVSRAETKKVTAKVEKDTGEPTPAVTQVKQAPPPEPDDLKVIEGIGPKIVGLLHDSGIVTFAQLSNMQLINLEVILKEADMQFVNPNTWAEQAALAAEGQWDELQKLQDELKGGREVA